MPEDLAALSTQELQRRYQETSGEPGDAEADALLDELVRRGEDI